MAAPAPLTLTVIGTVSGAVSSIETLLSTNTGKDPPGGTTVEFSQPSEGGEQIQPVPDAA
ncbi:MAG TPA: hypothetical protein VK889_01400 [Solirubrobacterales bacterium]|nr:hypothetical protein [Solirubrobacterales bacterium]